MTVEEEYPLDWEKDHLEVRIEVILPGRAQKHYRSPIKLGIKELTYSHGPELAAEQVGWILRDLSRKVIDKVKEEAEGGTER